MASSLYLLLFLVRRLHKWYQIVLFHFYVYPNNFRWILINQNNQWHICCGNICSWKKGKTKEFVTWGDCRDLGAKLSIHHLSRIRWCNKNIRWFDKIWMLVAVNVETWCKVAIQPKLQPLPAAAGCVHIVIWHNSRTLSYLTNSHSGTSFYIGRHSWTVYKVLIILRLLHSKSKTSWSRSWSVDPSKGRHPQKNGIV